MTITYVQSYFNKSMTATSDAPFSLSFADIWLREANMQVLSNDALMGDRNGQDFEMATGAVATFPYINLADVFIKNAGAGANTKIVVNGVVMTPAQVKRMFEG